MSSSYTCVVCEKSLRSFGAAFPNYYCPDCYKEWAPRESEPWLKDLVRQQIKHRVRRYRQKKSGINIVEVPLEMAGDI